MLLECCYHAIAAATKLAPTQDKKDALQAWRWASSDAGTMTEAHHIALDVHTWSTLLQSAATYSKLYKPAFHTDLTQLKNTWLAIVASLLDMGGLEETDLPDTYSLIDLIELAHTDGLLDLILSARGWPAGKTASHTNDSTSSACKRPTWDPRLKSPPTPISGTYVGPHDPHDPCIPHVLLVHVLRTSRRGVLLNPFSKLNVSIVTPDVAPGRFLIFQSTTRCCRLRLRPQR
ncbi:hypothetical protein DYB37_010766 [Aphanomyces astaci]|uniref:Uncharacterized protein n=1 Tax=Aphanomyces astaci TaxID=112090 RepID=A0A3R7F967_APHAT|nr:hypothetical protein DYB37_010766 [Aphanomyces astaci]